MMYADLVSSVIRYCLRAAHQGHWHLLRDVGLGEDEIRMLMDLNVQSLLQLERRLEQGGHPVQVRLDRSTFRRLLEEAQRWSASHATRLRLIEADAPQELMQRLYGMSAREYANLRAALSRPSAVGRPAEPDEETVDRISAAWEAAGHEDPDRLTGEEWLTLAASADTDVRTCYRVLLRWHAPPATLRRCKPPKPRARTPHEAIRPAKASGTRS